MLKRIAVLLLFLTIMIMMLVFTRLNPGLVEIDLAFGTIESSIPLAFTVTFVFGWLFGLCALRYSLHGLSTSAADYEGRCACQNPKSTR